MQPEKDAMPETSDVASSAGALSITSLPDAQVFSKDPEDFTTETLADTIERLRKIVTRQRKARQDSAEISALSLKFKKTNATAARKKAKTSTDIMETKI
jgi:hypothetical protein